MKKPGKYPLDLYRGDTYTWKFRLWADKKKTIPVVLTGATVKAELRDKPGGTPAVTFVTVVTEPNFITVDLSEAMWANAPKKKGSWDLQIKFASGEVSTVLAGDVKITMDVTDSTPAAGGLRAVRAS